MINPSAWRSYGEQAAVIVAAALDQTPIILSPRLGRHVYLKLETFQPTGSFKVRGALAALSILGNSADEFIVASTGNFALGTAWAAGFCCRSATVVVPEITSQAKIDALKRLSARLVIHGDSKEAAERYAQSQAHGSSRYISAAAEPAVIAGQGTVGSELLTQLDGSFTVVCGIGSGGLAAGIGLIAAQSGRIRVIGVEATQSPAMSTALRMGHVSPITVRSTLADGLAGNLTADSLTVNLIQRHVSDVITVTESEIAAGIRYLISEHGLVAEGAGAAPLAAVMAGKVSTAEPIVAIITGRNIARDALARVLLEAGSRALTPKSCWQHYAVSLGPRMRLACCRDRLEIACPGCTALTLPTVPAPGKTLRRGPLLTQWPGEVQRALG